ncbi:dienelactone hydrolase family protein [Bacillus freudenreichii]|nr:dienelactone hydrolase family protein [Bacillus freudenreichii]
MRYINKDSETVIIVIHEIYGINEHMKLVGKMLSEQNVDVYCPNLYKEETAFNYSEENTAYLHFMENVGFLNAAERIQRVISELGESYDKIYVVGFSVGATIAWLCSEEKGVDGIVGFYGSRIRDYIQMSPNCPTLLFFPEKEESFNVAELINSLKEKDVEIHIIKGQHGFSDPYSSKYDEKLAKQVHKRVIEFITTE